MKLNDFQKSIIDTLISVDDVAGDETLGRIIDDLEEYFLKINEKEFEKRKRN